MRLALSVIVFIIVIAVIAITVIALKSLMGVTPMIYVDKLRDLLINGSFTAVYNESSAGFSSENGSGHGFVCSETYWYSVGFVNGTRAVITMNNGSCVPIYMTPPSQEMIRWVNGTSFCFAIHVTLNKRGAETAECLPPGTGKLINLAVPFNELLGNVTINLTAEDYSINYSMITRIYYVNATKWRGQTTYCFQVTSEVNSSTFYGMEPNAALRRVINEYNVTEFLCLLPNGLPAIIIFNETITTKIPLAHITSRTSEYGVQELVSYELNYFNVTAFNEAVS